MNSIALKRFNQLALPEKGTEPDTIDHGNRPATFDITWQTLTDTFLQEYRGATQRTYRDAWNQFLAFCGISLEMSVTRVPDEDTVKAFRDSLLGAGQSPNTINAYLAAVRAFYRFLHDYARKSLRTGQITANRAGELQLLIEGVLAVRKVRVSNASGRLPTTVDQSRDLLASVPTYTLTDLRDRAMIALLIGCGLRRIELVRAVRKDLTPQNGQLLLRIQQKGHHAKDAFVVIWPDVERIIRPWLTQAPFKNPDSPLFPSLSKRDCGSTGTNSHYSGSPLTPRSVSRLIRNRLDAIGLKDHSTHSLRHAFASIALTSDDVELRDVQQALGHSQITTTERYIHQSNRLAGRPEKAVNDIVFTDLKSGNGQS
ncbi:MAG: tyrosine-type recombinase/integrase [bacterium]|nr:tyrosine-type recombinase/integrase [bacterium]